MSQRFTKTGVMLSMSALAFFASIASALAGPYAAPAQHAAEWLEARQDVSDGSWRDTSEVKTYLQTVEAVLALHQLNRRRTPYYAAQTWIKNHEPSNLDARARRLLMMRATQSSTQPDVDALLAAISSPAASQSGWGLAKRYHASPLDTALAMSALAVAGANYNWSQTITYLKSTQRTAAGDKGWTVGGGTTSDPYATARVVQSLAVYKTQDPTLATPLANAVATLNAKVNTNSPPHVRAAAALAYLSMDPNSSNAASLLSSLASQQRPDGGFDAGIFATALIAQAFAVAERGNATLQYERVDIPDAVLRQAINETMGRGAMDQINRGELAQLLSLDISNRGVTSLEGLQYAVNLNTLSAYNNFITDMSPIAGLTNLTNLNLASNPCTGCSTPVASASDNDGDVPLPAWALAILGAALLGVVRRAGNRSGNG